MATTEESKGLSRSDIAAEDVELERSKRQRTADAGDCTGVADNLGYALSQIRAIEVCIGVRMADDTISKDLVEMFKNTSVETRGLIYAELLKSVNDHRREKQSSTVIVAEAKHEVSPAIIWSSASASFVETLNDVGAVKEGSVLSIDLIHSGLSPEQQPDQLKLFVRKACYDLWVYLSKGEKDVSIVSGCPGVGKSVEVYAYAISQAKSGQRVLYIHANDVDGFFIVFKEYRDSDVVRTGRVSDFSSNQKFLFDFIDSVLSNDQTDLIVLDGQLGDLIRPMYFRVKKSSGVRLITCTSFQATKNISDQSYARMPPFSRFTMDSWTREEYSAAISAGALKLHPTVSSLEEIFYYAGSSVRRIQLPVDAVVAILDGKISETPDMRKLIGAKGVGDASESAVNSLMAIYSGSSIIVSEYVSRKLFDSVSDELMGTLRTVNEENRSWQGWISKIEVLRLLSREYGMRFRNADGALEIWFRRSTDRLSFHVFDDSLACSCLSPTADNICCWFQPVRWNQECFDAFFQASEHELRVIQITNATSHSCKLKYLIPFLKVMRVHVVDFVYVCRRRNFDKFIVPNPPDRILTSKSIEANTENEQYNLLVEAIQEIRASKAGHDGIANASINFRKVCYEKQNSDKPLDQFDDKIVIATED